MNSPLVAVMVNAGPNSIEAVRALGLTSGMAPERVRCFFREGSRWSTARRWWRELKRLRPDVLYVLNTALPGVPVARQWSRRTGVPYLLDTGDAVEEMARRSGIRAGWRVPILRWLETNGQKDAATVVVRGTKHREYLNKMGLPRVALIRDGFAPPTPIAPLTIAALRTKLGLDGQFVAGLMGSLVLSPRLQICYGWDLVRALTHLRDLPVTALIIGDGDGQAWLRAEAERLGVKQRVVFTGRIPYGAVPTYLRLMDVALSTQTNNLPGQVRTTGKLPEYMAAERFIIASRVGEAALLLPELMLLEYTGEVDPAYPLRLAERIRFLESHPDQLVLRHQLSETARRLCSYEVLSQDFQRVVSDAVSAVTA